MHLINSDCICVCGKRHIVLGVRHFRPKLQNGVRVCVLGVEVFKKAELFAVDIFRMQSMLGVFAIFQSSSL